MPGIKRRKTIFSSINNNKEDDTRYCDRCYQVGAPCILGRRIYGADEVIPSDDDLFRQCHTCGTVYPLYAARHLDDAQASDIVPVANPFSIYSTKMETMPFSQHGPKYFAKKNKQDQRKLGNKSISKYYVETSQADKDKEDKDISSFRRAGHIVKNVRDLNV
jgi:hypothetical protein